MKMKEGPTLHSADLSLVQWSTVLSKANSPEAHSLKWAGNDPTISYILEMILQALLALPYQGEGNEKPRGRVSVHRKPRQERSTS